MTTHTTDRKSAAPSYPDAYRVGPHLVIDASEWVPERAEPRDGRSVRRSPSYRCLACGERQSEKRAFSDVCEALHRDG